MEKERNDGCVQETAAEDSRLSKILNDALIKATDIYENPPQIIWVDNSTIATLGNFSASTGKAKSRKTFNVSAIVATRCCSAAFMAMKDRQAAWTARRRPPSAARPVKSRSASPPTPPPRKERRPTNTGWRATTRDGAHGAPIP